ncbi:MAG TPA: type II toxin-antitoxin system VapC family toxin [Armatimonadota bacterium]|nr:type II toxin-antitoxin system VapC family toxin [Armatimonadota bacterium]
MALVDTDVMVEAQRARPGAAAWLAELRGDVALPAAVAWELLIGSRDSAELERARRFLAGFSVVEIQEEDSARARELIGEHCLSSGPGLPDYLIAAQALTRQATLYTFNVRHYQAIPGLNARVPYARG